MTLVLWMVYLLFGILIIAPLIQGDLFKVDQKYYYFRYVSIVLLIWWLLEFLRLNATNGIMLYYFTLMIYPIVFLFVMSFYIAIKRHFGSQIHKITNVILYVFFFVDFLLAATNNLHNLLFVEEPSIALTFEDMLILERGIFFYVHTAVSYVFLVIVIVYIMKSIINRLRVSKDIYPFVFIISAILVGIALNIYQIFINPSYLDPTILTIAIVLSVLYYIFYIRDLKLLLGYNRNRFILNHLREKYIIVDEIGNVVDASSEFTNQFGITLDEAISYEDLLSKMNKTAVLFEESEDVFKNYKEDKIYLNTLEKPIYLPFYKHSGTFYLFFDQTADLKYIYEMNYIKTHDLVTKILNRNFLEDIRDKLDDEKTPYQVAMFDVDGLKLFNDYLGHNQGDELLKRFAEQLKQVTEKDDVYPIRLGGDEFIILAVNQTKNYISNLINTLIKFNETLPFIEKIQFSYAVSQRDETINNMKKVLASVDKKLYQMKSEKDNYKELLEKELQKVTNKKGIIKR